MYILKPRKYEYLKKNGNHGLGRYGADENSLRSTEEVIP